MSKRTMNEQDAMRAHALIVELARESGFMDDAEDSEGFDRFCAAWENAEMNVTVKMSDGWRRYSER